MLKKDRRHEKDKARTGVMWTQEMPSVLQRQRQSAERGQVSQMAEIKTVERVRLGEWDAQKDQEHGRGKGSLKLRLTSASNKII